MRYVKFYGGNKLGHAFERYRRVFDDVSDEELDNEALNFALDEAENYEYMAYENNVDIDDYYEYYVYGSWNVVFE